VLSSGTVKRLGLIPIWVALLALALSALLILVRLGSLGPFLGWILTPFVVVACLAWGRAQFVAQSSDPWFDRTDGRRKLLILQLLTLVAFIVSLPHVWRIGQEVALWLQ
jgi:Na+-translocating ferredoxin:NAD+ oxidoreductase RnfE subunit